MKKKEKKGGGTHRHHCHHPTCHCGRCGHGHGQEHGHGCGHGNGRRWRGCHGGCVVVGMVAVWWSWSWLRRGGRGRWQGRLVEVDQACGLEMVWFASDQSNGCGGWFPTGVTGVAQV